MNPRSVLEALRAGGKTAFLTAALGFAALAAYGAVTESEVIYLRTGLMTVAFISVFLGGLNGAMADGTLGWLHGGIVALFYLTVIWVVKALMFPNAEFGVSTLISSAGMLFAGAVGGVVGINLRPLQRQRIRKRYLRG